MVQDTSCVKLDGLRYFAPFEHEVRVKLSHHAGLPLHDALCGLCIGEASADWWRNEFLAGRVYMERRHGQNVELEKVDADYMVSTDDVALVRVHVHDRVVPDELPKVLHDDEDLLVVSKPPGIEVFINPLGGAVRSSLLGMLAEMGYKGLAPVHRIDKPVSGVVCMAKNKKAGSRLTRCIQGHRIKKTYVARVCIQQSPPPEGLRIDAPLSVNTATATAYVDLSSGKPSSTIVQKVLALYEDDGSGTGSTAAIVVEPITGRMHQIRCHLAHAGYPIANDDKYGAGIVTSHRLLYQDSAAAELQTLLQKHFREGCAACTFFKQAVAGAAPMPRLVDGIWLHSWKYEFPSLNLKFEAPLPPWAV